ncbi:HEPN family nuclease [Microbulbifer sp. ANSA003]|uniref:HEPN family nuclease n=1 Tax=unclassified Microbulbifer TaxID=2619833 RepID=UPI0040399C76
MDKFVADRKVIQESFNSTWRYIWDSAIAIKNGRVERLSSLPQNMSWSLLNPGSILASAYIYFVIGRESNLLTKFPSSKYCDFISKFNLIVTTREFENKSDKDKCKYIIRRLRNAISHGNVSFEDRNKEGDAPIDGNRYFIFYDEDPRRTDDKWCASISIPDFGNIVEEAGEVCFNT